MIEVGDTFIGIDGREEVVASIWLNSKTVGVESGLAYSYEEVYKSLYEQQKLRADTLTHAIMQIRNDLLIENEKLLHEIREYDLGVYDSNKNAIDRLDILIGVIEN